jgi:hypothetical protein
MSYEFNCSNCGRTGYGSSGAGPLSGANPPSGWITKWASTKIFCSNRCKDEFNKRNESSNSSSSSGNSSKSNPGMISSFIQNQRENEREENRLEEARIQKQQDTIDSILKTIIAVQFGQSVDEISDSLNKLVTISTSNNDEKIKKAIYEKMDYGIIKLKNLGANSEADFFQKKLDTIYIDKKKVNMQKAQKLRSEDKNIQAFLVENPKIKKILIVVGIILLLQLKSLIF